MKTWQERAIKTFVAIWVLIFLSSLVYHYLMITVEGRSPSYIQSLQVVVETYTGTGYGGHTTWESTVVNLFVSAMDLSTFLLVFIVLPYIFQPILGAALSPALPESSDQSDHVVVCGYSPRVESLVEEFRIRGADDVVVLDDEDQGMALLEKDISIVEGDPTDSAALDAAGVERATTVVVDVEDVESASTVLAARELSDSVRIVVLVEDPSLEHYLEYAGADRIITPRGLLGQRMAERVKTEVIPHAQRYDQTG